jgi:hypothetical protein
MLAHRDITTGKNGSGGCHETTVTGIVALISGNIRA